MCMVVPTTLGTLRKACADFVAGFDAALLPPAALGQALEDAGAIEKLMATACSLIAARLAGMGPAATAPRQAARHLAQASGTSLGQAAKALEAGKALASAPELSQAARAGELSRQQACLIAEALAANPGAAAKLVSLARTCSLQELADESARAKAAGQDLEARRQAVHAARALCSYTDASGTWYLRANGTPEAGAGIMAALRPFADKAFAAARAEGRRERPEAYGFDGLVALASSGGAGAVRSEVLFRVDHSALMRGYPVEGELCEVAGFGPTSAQAIVDLIETGDPFLKAVVTKGKEVTGVVHLGRRPNAHQQSALDWLFPTCAAEGCGTRATFLESDHRLEWSKCHITVLDLLDRLCKFHHGLKTNQGWSLVAGRGKRAFVPPEDPRHPSRAGPAS